MAVPNQQPQSQKSYYSTFSALGVRLRGTPREDVRRVKVKGSTLKVSGGFQAHQTGRLAQMNLKHLKTLRQLNAYLPFEELTFLDPGKDYFPKINLLNAMYRNGVPSLYKQMALENELLNQVQRLTDSIRMKIMGKARCILLSWVIENVLYLIERSEHFQPSDWLLDGLLKQIPPDVRMKAHGQQSFY